MVSSLFHLFLFPHRYINAATNSKNVLIMWDMSGSMLGQRYEIAKQTTEAILETLSHNDYFNIMPVGVLLLLLLSRPPSVLQVGLLPGRLCRRARPAPSHHEEQEAAAVEDE